MKRKTLLLIALTFLIVTAHRSPAPILEESPPPTLAPTAPLKPESTIAPSPRTEEKSTALTPHHPSPHSSPTKTPNPKDGTIIPKGAVHLVIHDDSDARKIFNYFRFPKPVAEPGTTGLYRIEVSPDGTVAAVTILKSMGSAQDVAYMKAFITWRAAPGPLRLVDVPRRIFTYWHVKS